MKGRPIMLHKDQLPEPTQRRIRGRAVQYFFPDSGLKPLRAGSVLFTNRQGLVAHVSTAQRSGAGDVRFWYGFRKNHLPSISKAKEAYFVACCYLDEDRTMYFSFPCSANDKGAFICGRQLLSESKDHFNVELIFSEENMFYLNTYNGDLIDATFYVAPPGKIAHLPC
jgi:hypothetical protein